MDKIEKLENLRPGDIMFGPIGGLVGVGVGLGQLALGEAFRMGKLSVRHVGIVVEASRTLPPGTLRHKESGRYYGPDVSDDVLPKGHFDDFPTGVITAPRLVQAMPHGAEEIEMRRDTHWTPRHAYIRLPEDYPGQAGDAAAIARLMVTEGVAYSFASYGALALWHWGVKTPRLEAWIGRRRGPIEIQKRDGLDRDVRLPVEAICSVLADQSWSLAGKRVMEGTVPQVVTPGRMAGQLWDRPGVVRGGFGVL
ncbi:MAG: hypothetical protein ABW022_17720 [Actinoplanes sp.]